MAAQAAAEEKLEMVAGDGDGVGGWRQQPEIGPARAGCQLWAVKMHFMTFKYEKAHKKCATNWRQTGGGRGGRRAGAGNNHGNKYLLRRHQMRVFMANQTFATDTNWIYSVATDGIERLAAK